MHHLSIQMKISYSMKVIFTLFVLVSLFEIVLLLMAFYPSFVNSFLAVLLTLIGAYTIFRLEIKNKKKLEKERKNVIINSTKNEIDENINVSNGYKKYENEFKKGIYYDIYYDFNNSLLQKLNENITFGDEETTKSLQESIKVIKIINRLVDLIQENHPRRNGFDLSVEIEKFRIFLIKKRLRNNIKKIVLSYLSYLKNIYGFFKLEEGRYVYDPSLEKKINEDLKRCFELLKKHDLSLYEEVYCKFIVCDLLKKKFLLSLTTYLSIFQMNNQLSNSLLALKTKLESLPR